MSYEQFMKWDFRSSLSCSTVFRFDDIWCLNREWGIREDGDFRAFTKHDSVLDERVSYGDDKCIECVVYVVRSNEFHASYRSCDCWFVLGQVSYNWIRIYYLSHGKNNSDPPFLIFVFFCLVSYSFPVSFCLLTAKDWNTESLKVSQILIS